jgi:hypothetical protein
MRECTDRRLFVTPSVLAIRKDAELTGNVARLGNKICAGHSQGILSRRFVHETWNISGSEHAPRMAAATEPGSHASRTESQRLGFPRYQNNGRKCSRSSLRQRSPAPGFGAACRVGVNHTVHLRLQGRQTAPGVRGVLFEGGAELPQLPEDELLYRLIGHGYCWHVYETLYVAAVRAIDGPIPITEDETGAVPHA